MAPIANTPVVDASATSASNTSGITTVQVVSDKVKVSDGQLYSTYSYENAIVSKNPSTGKYLVQPKKTDYEFKLDLKVGKTGLLLVGLGGNNGSTLTSAIYANKNKLSFHNKLGKQDSNYYGSVTQASTLKLGIDENGHDVYVPFNEILPFVHPNDLIVGGWDINNANLSDAIKRSKVLDYDLQRQLFEPLKNIVPLPSVYYPDFIAANQEERANNVIPGNDKWEHVEIIRKNIRDFKSKNQLDNVIVLWTANTERYADVLEGVNDTSANLLNSIKSSHDEIAPSTIFAVASILEGIPYINGSPQNTFVPGVIELAEQKNTFIAGDDFKSGQTKLKSVLAQFLVDAGIRPVSVASYNHLGNNDGYNLSSPKQFRSKEISKQSVIDDIIDSNSILYNDKKGKKVDHCIVIKYIPAVCDDKVAMDEYHSELMLGGHNTISIHNVCEDSLLATPLIIDLVVMTEFLSRVSYKEKNSGKDYENLHSVLSFLSYWLKAPLVRPGTEPVNGLNKQRAGLENFLRLLIGLSAQNELKLEERLK